MADKKIYTVATSHLDTVWSWDFETTVSKYIYNTLVDNFKLFEKYPTYKFSFEGSYRYELMEEYYPELFEKMKEYIKNGKSVEKKTLSLPKTLTNVIKCSNPRCICNNEDIDHIFTLTDDIGTYRCLYCETKAK